jgi:hypothetical protein
VWSPASEDGHGRRSGSRVDSLLETRTAFSSARLLLVLAAAAALASPPSTFAAVATPVLKWSYRGCSSGPYCQTGWYSSPAVVDLDGDGQADVVWGAYDVVALNGSNGGLKWRATNDQRVWPGVAVADLTGDGTLEVIVGRSGDQPIVVLICGPDGRLGYWGGRNDRLDRTGTTARWAVGTG